MTVFASDFKQRHVLKTSCVFGLYLHRHTCINTRVRENSPSRAHTFHFFSANNNVTLLVSSLHSTTFSFQPCCPGVCVCLFVCFEACFIPWCHSITSTSYSPLLIPSPHHTWIRGGTSPQIGPEVHALKNVRPCASGFHASGWESVACFCV